MPSPLPRPPCRRRVTRGNLPVELNYGNSQARGELGGNKAAAEVHRAAWSTQGTRGYTGFIRATPLPNALNEQLQV
jgi:hypothetical protein